MNAYTFLYSSWNRVCSVEQCRSPCKLLISQLITVTLNVLKPANIFFRTLNGDPLSPDFYILKGYWKFTWPDKFKTKPRIRGNLVGLTDLFQLSAVFRATTRFLGNVESEWDQIILFIMWQLCHQQWTTALLKVWPDFTRIHLFPV